jgi:HEAT repeat protein
MRRWLFVLLCLLADGCGRDENVELAQQLAQGDVQARRAAARALDQLGSKAISAQKALEQAVADSNPEIRRLACHALGEIGPGSKSANAALHTALADQQLSVRLVAALALQKTEPKERAYVPILTKAMQMGEGGVIVAVGGMGAQGDWATATLVGLLGDNRPGIRRLAAEALGRIGPAARQAEPSLRQSLHDPDGRVRDAAADALEAIQGPGLRTTTSIGSSR